jgi:hypothetical protein
MCRTPRRRCQARGSGSVRRKRTIHQSKTLGAGFVGVIEHHKVSIAPGGWVVLSQHNAMPPTGTRQSQAPTPPRKAKDRQPRNGLTKWSGMRSRSPARKSRERSGLPLPLWRERQQPIHSCIDNLFPCQCGYPSDVGENRLPPLSMTHRTIISFRLVLLK